MHEQPPSGSWSSASPPAVPGVLWAFAGIFLAEGVVQALVNGPKPDGTSLVGSIVLGVALVVFFSVGVTRARGIRTGIVAVLLVLAVLAGVVGVAVDPSVDGIVVTVLSAVQAVLLWRYTRTDWWAWQRTRPEGGRSPVPLLALAVAVGVLGGVADGPVGGRDVEMSFDVSL